MFAWQATVQDERGNAVLSPVVTVYESDGVTLASIYSEAGAALPNPLTGTPEGFVQFWAEAGEYKIEGVYGGQQTAEWSVFLDTPLIDAVNRAEVAADTAEDAAALAEIYADEAASYSGPMRTFFVSNAGSDSNTGLTVSDPFATVTKASSVAARGDIVRLKRGDVFRETATFTNGVVVDVYAGGQKPVISGQDIVTDFEIYSTGPAYTFEIDLPAGFQGRSYVGVWENGKRMREYRIDADGITDYAGVIAAVESNPGSFGFLSWDVMPSTSTTGGWAAGINEYIIHASDGSDPSSNGKLYEAYKRAYSVTGSALYKNIRLISGWQHDGITASLEDCSIERVARHGDLPDVPQFNRVAVIGPNPSYSGSSFHSNPPSLVGDCTYKEAWAIGDESLFPRVSNAFFSHGTTGNAPIRDRVTMTDCYAYAHAVALRFDEVNHVDCLRFKTRECDSHVSMGINQTFNIIDGDMRGGRGGSGVGALQTRGHRADNQLNIIGGYYDWRGQRFFGGSGEAIQNISVSNAIMVLRPEFLSGALSSFAWNPGALANLKISTSVIINMGDPASMATLVNAGSVTGCEFRDVLIIGQSAQSGVPTTGDCLISNVTTPITTIDPSARVFGVDVGKAVESDGQEGVKLKYGTYQSGDSITHAVAVTVGNNQPRSYCLAGEKVYTTTGAGSNIIRHTYTPTHTMRAAMAMVTGTRFAVCGDNGLFASTATGLATTWTEVATGTSDSLLALSANAAVVVAVGDAGAIMRSEDSGATWAEVLNGGVRYTSNNLRGISANGSTWIAVGDAGTVLRSTDNGVTWAATTQGANPLYASFRSVVASLFIIGGENGALYTSADGAAWVLRTTRTPNRIVSIGESDGEIVAALRQSSRHLDTFINSANAIDWVVDDSVLPFEVNGIAGSGPTIPSTSNEFAFVCGGEAQTMGWRRRGPWNVQRFRDTVATTERDSMANWLINAR